MPRTALFAATIAFLPAGAWGQTCNTADRSVLLILDASGSMNARLPNGETRMAVARRAIKGVATLIPAGAQLSLRLYGAQSAASRRNCEDTHVGVPFGPAGASSGAIAATVDSAKAQGYTPIAYSLGQAAIDFPADAKERVIVLVSDGKETCRGDPVIAARALAAKGITVHTVGFIVDTAARGQLQAIARATGGTYFDAPVGPELPDTLKKAFNACRQRVVALPAKPKPGKLRTTSATWLTSHDVLNAETGQKVGAFNSSHRELTLPAGIYEVKFGPASWKGIEVRPGETTTIDPGILKVEVSNPSVHVNARVVDSETGETHGRINPVSTSVTLMPGVYDLRFRKAEWRFVKIDGGKTVTLRAVAVILAPGLKWKAARITRQDGTEVFRFNAVTSRAALPPGDYIVEVDGNKIPFPATEGEVLEVKPQ
ncbi:MAG: vWA domain-containing protein [Xanthobacteraceae bacterium]